MLPESYYCTIKVSQKSSKLYHFSCGKVFTRAQQNAAAYSPDAKIPTSDPECVSALVGAPTGLVWLKSVKVVMLTSTLLTLLFSDFRKS